MKTKTPAFQVAIDDPEVSHEIRKVAATSLRKGAKHTLPSTLHVAGRTVHQAGHEPTRSPAHRVVRVQPPTSAEVRASPSSDSSGRTHSTQGRAILTTAVLP